MAINITFRFYESDVTSLENAIKDKADKTYVAALEADVDANTSNITTLQSQVLVIKTDIATNSAGVAKNKSDIAVNTLEISKNKTDIAALQADKADKTDTVTKSDLAALEADVDANTSNITTLKTNISKKQDATDSSLSTRDTTIVGAINELDREVGQLSKLTTTQNQTIVDSINELDSNVGNIQTDIQYLTGNVTNLQNNKLNRIENELNTDAKVVVTAINSINSKLESMLNIYHKGSVTFHYKTATLPPAPIVLLKHAPAGTYKTHGHIETSVTPEAPYDKCCIVLLDVDAYVPTIDIINKNDIKGVYNLGDDIVITDHAQVVLYPCDKDYINSRMSGTAIIELTYDYDMLVTGLWVSEKFIEESYLSGLISEVEILSGRIGSTTNAELKGMTIGQALDYIMTKINA